MGKIIVFEGNWHYSTDLPEDTGEGYSDDVLIDMNGWRKEYAIGWYDYDDKVWRFHQADTSYFELEHMVWSYLPLQKYDQQRGEGATEVNTNHMDITAKQLLEACQRLPDPGSLSFKEKMPEFVRVPLNRLKPFRVGDPIQTTSFIEELLFRWDRRLHEWVLCEIIGDGKSHKL